MTDTPSFPLTTSPWISCLAADGSTIEISLRDLFDGEHPVLALRGDSPTQDYAVLRVLLAIFWRAHRATLDLRPSATLDFDDWRDEAWERAADGLRDDAVLEYLDRYADRLDLLHPATPFMQVADLHTQSGSTSPVTRIIPEAEGHYFTMRAGDAIDSLTFSEAARWLIHAQAYDYSGIKSGAVGDTRVQGGRGYPIGTGWTGMTGGTTVLGSTLRETLVLNTTSDSLFGADDDRPVWEREPDGPAERAVSVPAGAADILTWQSRRIRLFHDGEVVTAVLVSNGDRIPDAGANVDADPMTPYRFSSNKSTRSRDVYYPKPFDTERMMWRALEPLVALGGDLELVNGMKPPKRPRTLDALAILQAQGLGEEQWVLNLRLTSASYGPQASSAAATVDGRIDIPRALLHENSALARVTVLDAARATLSAAVELGKYAGNLLVAAGGEYEFQAPQTDSLLGELEPAFRSWLRHLRLDALDEYAAAWQKHVRSAVEDRAVILLRGAGPTALIGRVTVQNDREIHHSAGFAYDRLRRRLREVLPLLVNHHAPPDPATGAPIPIRSDLPVPTEESSLDA